MLEHTGRYNNPELFLKEFKHWVVVLRELPFPATLGTSTILLKRNVPAIGDVLPEEMAEFPEVCKWFESRCQKLFGAEKFNYHANMMKEFFVHFHVFPRYSKEVEKYNLIWTDPDWPRPTASSTKFEVSREILLLIKRDITEA